MSYPVGAICIGQNLTVLPRYNGMQCEVIEPARYDWFIGLQDRNLHQGIFYTVRWSDGVISSQYPHQLKRKDWYDEEKRAEYQMRLKSKERAKVSKLISACLSAIEAGEKVDQEEGAQ